MSYSRKTNWTQKQHFCMKQFLLFILFSVVAAIGFCQNSNISGTINKYSKVTAIEYCGNRIIVDSPSLFQVGMQVLIIQMQGVTINQANSSAYGNILAYNSAGNYEIQTIDSILGDTIKFTYQIAHTYDPTHSVQLMPLPVYQTATVAGVLTCKGWEGNTGGVLLLKADTLILNSNIDISGKGFRGFYNNDSSQNCFGNLTDYYYTDSMHGSIKGEGVVQYPYLWGRGKNANGGGGGDNENTGGGGGSNGSKGGAGGAIVPRSSFCLGNGPGDGGVALSYNDTLNKIFMGGGGGCGHGNNSEGTSGTNGAAICLIIANTVIGNSQSILANGIDQNNIAGSDGAGGGGAGGTVLLDVTQYVGNLSVIAHGGLGGSLDNDQLTRSCMGPAGGGSGGVLWVNQASVPANITYNAAGGANGINLDLVSTLCAYGVTNGALPGDTGISVTNLAVAIPGTNYIRLSATASNDTVLCNDQQITLSATGYSSNSVYYIWSPGQQTSSISFLATQTGPYSVTVTDANTCSVVKQINVAVYNVSPNFTPNTSVCSPQNVTLSAQNPFPTGVTYAWSNGTNSPSITFFADSTTSYAVTVTSDSLHSCIAIDTIYVVVGNLVLNYSPGTSVSVCPGNAVTLSVIDSSAAILTYAWSTGATTDSVTVFPTVVTTYTVTVSEGANCTAVHNFLINMDYLGTVITPDTTICPGSSASLSVAVPGVSNVSYHWSDGETTGQISVTTSMTATYSVTVSSSNGCTGSASVNIDIDSVKVSTIPASDTTICPGSAALLSVFASGIGRDVSYLWSTSASTSSINASPSGDHNYTVTATDSLGCTGNVSVLVDTSNNASHLNLQITAVPDSAAGPGDSVQLSVPGGQLITFLWAPGKYLSDSTIQSPIAAPLIATDYCVTVTDDHNCTAEICKEIYVGIPPAEIAIPDAFSPDNDGKNDLYIIPAIDGTIIASVKIYDRWGTLLFDDVSNAGWDGTYKGVAQPVATYTCYITYYQKLYPGSLFYKVGTFNLFR
jgi:gliding motility-associated-like protein